MAEFRIRENAYPEIRNQLLRRITPSAFIGLAFMAIILTFTNKENDSMLPFVIPIMIVVLSTTIFLSVKKQLTLLKSYRLTIEQNEITMVQGGAPAVTISTTFLQEITKHKNGYISIKGMSGEMIVVPVYIERYEELEMLLSNIKPFTPPAASFMQKYQWLLVILMLGGIFAVYNSTNKILVAAGGVIFVSIMIWGFIVVQRSPHTAPKVKKLSWWFLLVIASIISNIVMQLIRMS